MSVTLITGFHLEQFRSQATLWMPEYEKHPKYQSALGNQLAMSGEDCIVVTHSENIFNGIRVAVCRQGAALPLIKFVNLDGEIVDVVMDRKGRIEVWPMGFFDQADEDLNKILFWDTDAIAETCVK